MLLRLRSSADLLAEADDRLHRPATTVVAAVPLLGRSLDAERAVVDAARAAVGAAVVAAEAVPDLEPEDGGLPVERLARLGTDLDREVGAAERALRRLERTSTALTPGQVGEAVAEARADLEPAVSALRGAASGSLAAADLLGADGPRSILVVLQNNAELRGAGGYFGAFALATGRDGKLAVGPFRDPTDVSHPPERAVQVEAPAEFREDYGPFLADTTLWQMFNMSPDVPDSAAVGAAVAGKLLGDRPDAVLLLDTVALGRLVELGDAPVRLPSGDEVDGDDLLEALLVDTYSDAGDDYRAQAARQRELRAAAGTTAAELLTSSDVEADDAARAVRRLVAGRHLAVWAADPETQEHLVEAGAAGRLAAGSGDLVHVSVNNLTANKLDYYVDRQVEHSVTLRDDRAEVVQRVVLTNRAPADLVPYVAGQRQPGTSDLRVELSTSPRAQVVSLTVDGADARGDVRRGEDRTRVLTYVTLSRGEQVEVELRYALDLEDDAYRATLVPQPLARPAELTIEITGQELAVPDGFSRDGAVLRRAEEWEGQELLEVAPAPRSTWEQVRRALRDFWSEPVALP
ncbi:MAG: DUF4012 domain-containing protein [Actinomycetes bacterium]